jgi:hypothetical protein
MLRFRWAVVAVAALLVGGALTFTRGLGQRVPAAGGRRAGPGSVVAAARHAAGQTDEAFRRIEGVIEQMPHVESVFTMSGGALWGGVISERSGMARASVQLVSARAPRDACLALGSRAREPRSRARYTRRRRIGVSPPRIPGIRTTLSGADISIGIVGDDLRQLEAAGWAIVDRLEGTPGLLNFEFAREDRSPLLSVEVDRERAAALGLNVSEVGESIRHALFGVVPTRFSVGNAEYDIRSCCRASAWPPPTIWAAFACSVPTAVPCTSRRREVLAWRGTGNHRPREPGADFAHQRRSGQRCFGHRDGQPPDQGAPRRFGAAFRPEPDLRRRGGGDSRDQSQPLHRDTACRLPRLRSAGGSVRAAVEPLSSSWPPFHSPSSAWSRCCGRPALT